MERQDIIMNFTVAPSKDDLEVIAKDAIAGLPEELLIHCESLVIQIEDMPDETLESELDLEDPYDLVILYRSGKQLSPGVQKKVANDDDTLIIFRRPLLDLWVETGDDINTLVRQVVIEELGHNFEFSDEDIEELTQRHYQGML